MSPNPALSDDRLNITPFSLYFRYQSIYVFLYVPGTNILVSNCLFILGDIPYILGSHYYYAYVCQSYLLPAKLCHHFTLLTAQNNFVIHLASSWTINTRNNLPLTYQFFLEVMTASPDPLYILASTLTHLILCVPRVYTAEKRRLGFNYIIYLHNASKLLFNQTSTVIILLISPFFPNLPRKGLAAPLLPFHLYLKPP